MGAVFLNAGLHKKPKPQGFPKLPGAMAGQPGKRGRLFPRRGRLPRYAPAYFHRGAALFFSPIPQGMGNTKAPTEEKRWEQCFIFQIAWKFKPQGLSQTARSNGGTTRKTREIFLSARAGSPVIHRRIFAEGRPCSSPNPAGNGKHKSSHRRKKVGVVFMKAEPIDKAGGKKTGKRLEGASCALPQPLRMRTLKRLAPPGF